MAVTLYSNYIDYNGDRTFIAVNNCQGDVANCGDFQCQGDNCAYLADWGETIGIRGTGFRMYNCNCACNC